MPECGRTALRWAHHGCHEPRRQVRKPLDSRRWERTIRRAHQAYGLYTRKETGHRIRVPVLSSLSQGDANCLCHLFGMLDSARESWLEAIQNHRGRGRRGNHKPANRWRNPPEQRNHLQRCCQRGTGRCYPGQRLWIWPEWGWLWWRRRRRNGRSRRWWRSRRRWWRGEAGEAEAAPQAAKMPKWALNLDVGSIRLPATGVINNDSSEGAAQLFDNAVLAKVMGMYKYYYKQRVLMTLEDYRAEMTTGRVGRLDLDGICPYTGENDDGSLRRPTEEELDVMFRAKAKEEEWMQGETMYGGRPRDMLMTVVKTLEIYEKLMERLVLAGFKPEDLQFLIPMNKMKGTSEEKNEMRSKMSSFLCRLLKSAFPNSTQYTYFRAGDHGFEDCLEIPAFAVYLSYREQERQLELLVTATQCNVNLPPAFIGRIAHAIKRAEQEAARGHVRWLDHIAPNVDPKIVQNVYKAIGSTEGAKRAVDDVAKAEARASEAEAKSRGGPKAYGPKPPPPKVAPISAPSYSSSSSSAAAGPAKAKPAPKQMPTSAKSSRPSPTDKPQPAPQYKKKRTDWSDLFFFPGYWWWLGPMWCTPSSLMNITKNDM